MIIPQIPNLKVTQLPENILHVHQIKPPNYFSCCDGLLILPKKGRNKQTIILDLNIEPKLIINLHKYIGSVSTYICSHGHMDHITHVHKWESLGAKIYAPFPEYTYLADLKSFYEGFGFNKAMSFDVIQRFAEANKYQPCHNVESFNPGHNFKLENLEIETLPLLGHSKAHIGFFLPQERILHISCLGFDLVLPKSDGFGPWYGFEECSIDQYLKDINFSENLFLSKARFLTSSHSKVIESPDISPFTYMREKIEKNQKMVDRTIINFGIVDRTNQSLKKLLELDLFFPKRKMQGFMREIYYFWESGLTKKHLERSSYIP